MKLQLQIVVSGNGQQQLNNVTVAVNNIGNAANRTNGQLSSIIKTIRDIRTIIATIESARMFAKIVTEGVQFNSLLETSKYGLAALIATFTDMTDATGRHLTMLERYNYAQGMAIDLQNRMKIAALQTTLQYSDLLDVMQRGLPFMLKYFHDKDRNVVSNQKIVDFTTAFSQGAQAFGLSPEEIGTNIQRLLQGTADARHARFAYALLQDIGGNPAQTKEQLKLWEQQGVLYDKLMEKVQAFKRAGQDMMGTFAGTWSNFKDAIQQALGEGTTGATRELRDLLKEITGHIVTIGADGKATFNQDFVNAVRDLATLFVTLASALAKIAEFLVTSGPLFKEMLKELANPNLPKLISTLLGAIAGGMIGGPGGALLGAAGMYTFRTGTQSMDALKEAEWQKRIENYQLERDDLRVEGGMGIAEIRKFVKGTPLEKLGTFHNNGNNYYTDNDEAYGIGRLYTQSVRSMGSSGAVLKALYDAAKKTGDGVPTLALFRAELEKIQKATDGIQVKSKPIPPDPEEMRKRALALEKYREALTTVISTLSKNELKASFDAAMDSYDALIAKAKANDKFTVAHVNMLKDRDPWHRSEELYKDTTLSERQNPFPAIDLERQKEELKALNEYQAALDKIGEQERKLADLKKQASLSKFKPEDVQKEKEAQKAITDAKLEAEKAYDAALKKARTEAEAKTDAANAKILKEVNDQTLADVKEAWLEHYQNRLKMEEEAMQRTVNLYHGLFDTVKQGTRSIVDAMMSGKGNPFATIAESFKKTWVEYLGSITDTYLNQLTVIASGEHKPYRYTKPGETGPNDPGGLPLYANSQMTKNARLGIGIAGAGVELYNLISNPQGLSKNQGAVSGALSGAALGAQIAAGPYAWVGAIVGALVGGIAGYLGGKDKVSFKVSASNGKLVVSGSGSANSQDVNAAIASINQAIDTTAISINNLLFSLPANVLSAITLPKQSDIFGNKFPGNNETTRWFNSTSLQLFLKQDIPQLMVSMYQPVLEAALAGLGVSQNKIKDIFKGVNQPGFDANTFVQQITDYVQIITGLQDAMRLMSTPVDNGSGWDMRVEKAHDLANPTAYSQISELDARIAAIAQSFGDLDFPEQLAAGKQVLALAQQRNQIEMQALVALRSAWMNIKDNIDQNKDSINYSELADPNDPTGTAARQAGYWRGKAAGAMTNLLGLMNNPNATVDDVNKYASEAQNAAMNLYQTMKTRYEDEMALVKQIAQAVKDVTKGFEDAKFAINFDQARTGTDADGNPIYDKKKQADMILAQQRDLFDQLKTATDPAEVARISGEIQKNASQLYDLWGRTPEAAKQVLAQLTDAENLAKDTLKRLSDEAAAEAQKYKDAANEALAILTATADIANAVIAGMQHKIEELDPNAYHNLDTVLGALGLTGASATNDIDDLGAAADRTSGKLDEFGDNLLSWSRRFDSESHSDYSPVASTSKAAAASNGNGAPVIILNGSMAAVADEVEVRIGNKIFRQAVSTMQRQSARSGNF